MHNHFGRRYIRLYEFTNYATHLDLFPQRPGDTLFEYLEAEGLLNPTARVRFPGEIARRFASEDSYGLTIPEPIEPDTPRLAAAAELYNELSHGGWLNPQLGGEREHVLDMEKTEHSEFVRKQFSASSFTPWSTHRVPIWVDQDGLEVFEAERYCITYYHYWQIFILAAILRARLRILYPFIDEEMVRSVHHLRFLDDTSRSRLRVSINVEARREFNEINLYTQHFDAVAYFEAHRRNALQLYWHEMDPNTRVLSAAASRAYRRQELEIAARALNRFALQPADLIDFIGQQSEWWDTARKLGPTAINSEYKRNIGAAIRLYRYLTNENFNTVSNRIGRRRGWFKPILEIVFPNWLEDQRDLAKRILRRWADPVFNGLPSPFGVTEVDVDAFCDWLEAAGLYQFYWHFRRLADIGQRDAPIYRAAASAEAVAFANLIEMIANAACEECGYQTRGKTLFPKLRYLLDGVSPPDLSQLLVRFRKLTNTKRSTLTKRLAQIDQIRRGGPYAPIVQILLKLLVIRNEGSHLGLNRFGRSAVIGLIETMAVASLIIWKTGKLSQQHRLP